MKIEFDKNCSANLIYKKILIDGVTPIIHRINMDFSDVLWIIYDDRRPPEAFFGDNRKDIISQLSRKCITASRVYFPKDGYDYGCCDFEKRIVYVSLATIRAYKQPVDSSLKKFLFPNEQALSFFTRVIIDELAHIATKKGHGSQEYQKTLIDFSRRCLGL